MEALGFALEALGFDVGCLTFPEVWPACRFPWTPPVPVPARTEVRASPYATLTVLLKQEPHRKKLWMTNGTKAWLKIP